VADDGSLNRLALNRYVRRVADRWPVERALVGGTRVVGAGDADYVVVLVSPHFDGIPWLERVHQAGNLWDASEMGAPADIHCYTPVEFERKVQQLRVVRETAEQGVDLLGGE
jgi:hypothetical protein